MITPNLGLSLRSAGAAGDISFLVGLRNRLARYFVSPVPATPAQTFKLFETSRTYIVEQDNHRVGTFALYNFVDETAEFGRFMIDPSVQYGGIGTGILSLALEEAAKLELRYLHLTAKGSNEVALRLYARAGFLRRPSVNGLILMWRELGK